MANTRIFQLYVVYSCLGCKCIGVVDSDRSIEWPSSTVVFDGRFEALRVLVCVYLRLYVFAYTCVRVQALVWGIINGCVACHQLSLISDHFWLVNQNGWFASGLIYGAVEWLYFFAVILRSRFIEDAKLLCPFIQSSSFNRCWMASFGKLSITVLRASHQPSRNALKMHLWPSNAGNVEFLLVTRFRVNINHS